jgi:hypothetical protein
MGNKRKYKVEVVMTGNPPAPEAVLKNDKGTIIGPNDTISFNKDDDGLKKVEHYDLIFELDNPNKTRLRFVENLDDVLWVHSDTSCCPTSQCSLPGVIWADSVYDYRTALKVINMDMTKEQFRFRINLVDRGIINPTPADFVMIDPIGDNQDRGSLGTRDSMSVYTTVAVGFAAGLVAFAAARAFLPQLAW